MNRKIKTKTNGKTLLIALLTLGMLVGSVGSAFAATTTLQNTAKFTAGVAGASELLDFNSGGSQIYDDWHLHIKTDDNLYLDAPGITYVSGAMNLAGAFLIGNGNAAGTAETITFGSTGGSSIYDDWHMHIVTDDDLFIDAPGTTTISGILSVGTALIDEVVITPVAAESTSTTEGGIYYNDTDNNLYVYNGSAWVDLTAGATGAITLDTAYNTSSGASTIIVDAGELSWDLYDGDTDYNFVVDIQGASSEFQVQADGTAKFSIADAGAVTSLGTMTIGANSAGVDVTTYGTASGAVMLWDTSDNRLELNGADLSLEDDDILQFGDGQDVTMVWDNTDFHIAALTDDSVINIGDGTLSFDLKVYGGAAANLLTFDASANTWTYDDIDVILGDNDILEFGDAAGGDVYMRWDAGDFDILAGTDDYVIKFGDGTKSFDMWWYGEAATNNVVADASANTVTYDAVDLYLGDDDLIDFGDGQDVQMRWDGTDFDILMAADDKVINFGAADGNVPDIVFNGNVAAETLTWDASAATLDIASTMTAADNMVQLTLIETGTTASQILKLDYADGSNGLASGGGLLEIDNSDAADTVDNGILFTAASTMTDAIDASAANVTNAINVGPNTILGTTALINFTDFDLSADGLMVFASDGAGDQITIAVPALDFQAMVVDATTAVSTQTAGMIDLNVKTITNTAVGGVSLALAVNDAASNVTVYGHKTDVTVDTDAGHAHTVYGQYIGLTANDANSTTYGMAIQAEDAGGQVVTAGLLINNAQATDIDMTDGILITATTDASIVDGVDVSDAELTNALNVGANAFVGTTGAITYSGATTWSSSGGSVTVHANHETGNLTLGGGDTLPGAVANGNDVEVRAEDDFIVTTTDDVLVDATAGIVTIDGGEAVDAAILLQATAADGGVHITAGDGEVAAVATNESIELRASADTIVALTAGGSLVVDADTTNTTNTAGAVDINVGTITANAVGLDIALTQDDTAGAGEDAIAQNITLTGNDADGDVFGIKITAASTANAGTGTYDAAILIDNADTTAASMTDAIRITSTGVNTGITDAIDASADNIVNALNFGANTLLGTGDIGTTASEIGDVFLADSKKLQFGAGQDITMAWDGNDFDILQATADSSFKFGVDGAGIDIVWYGDTTSSTFTWDQSADKLILDGSDIQLKDDDVLEFGDTPEVSIKYDEAGDDRLEIAGTNADLWLEDVLSLGKQAVGTTGANTSVTVVASYIEVTFTTAGDDIILATTGANEGDLVFIVSVGANTGQLDSQTGTMKVDGGGANDLDMTQYDGTLFAFDGTNWCQLSKVPTNASH